MTNRNEEKRSVHLIQLHEGCYISEYDGDPPRTQIKKFAKRYPSKSSALRALAYYIDKNNHRDSSKWEVIKEQP